MNVSQIKRLTGDRCKSVNLSCHKASLNQSLSFPHRGFNKYLILQGLAYIEKFSSDLNNISDADSPAGQGLPAGVAEVEIIQHARAQRALEATLPPLNDLSQVDRRRQIIKEMCLNEWAFREKQVQK